MQDFDKLWNYNNPAETAEKFIAILNNTDTGEDKTYIAQLYTQLARTQSLQGNWDDTYAYLDKAKLLLPDADKVSEVRYLLELGRTYNSSGKKSEAYNVFDKAWELGKSIGADGYTADAGHMLAIASDTPEKTLTWNLKTVEFASQSDQPEAQRWLGSLYNNLGWTYFDDGDPIKALDMFELALVEREKQGNPENIRIAKWCIARIKRELGHIDEALSSQLDLLEEDEKLGNQPMFVYEELAHCYSLQDQPDKAKPYAQKAYDLLSQDDWYIKNEPERLEALQAISK